ncbi:hypothetical protein GA762_23465 [Salmonella enterica subsp. enterica]|nr:hypothetical protein [Salmonella enterica]EBG5027394.1 hypothetical protein [Salmonella enterica subsp. enterica serovar Oranienburg]ECD0388927.1 hypothetical protein [Salmonella enterica subsp. enterica serovar Oranienburg]ECG5862741.1 hypothetical protein [Salmonella enterica subsp. enterica serovar Oranienburg]ECY5265861.1 hypothetical protein [Salmonella enterica subsp. enterica serovar Oranienburg]
MKMKKYNLSLIKKGILFSLVLLSPEILAAERLGFNYTRPDALSLEPKLGLQARGCHAPSDPMNISFRFSNVEMSGSDATKGLRVKLTLKGMSYPKSYSVLTYVPAPMLAHNTTSDKTKADEALLVPWGMTVQGSSEGQTGHYQMFEHPAQYENPFCFSLSVADIGGQDGTGTSLHLYPIYRDPNYNGKANPFWNKLSATWDKYCQGKQPDADSKDAQYFYWPDYYTTPTDNPDEEGYTIWARIHGNGPNTGMDYLLDHMFYGGKVTPPPSPGFSGELYNDKFNPVTYSDPVYTYTFPAGKYNTSFVNNGNFLLKLNNRAIISMTLTLYDGTTKKASVFEWKRSLSSGGYPTDNTLHYQNNSVRDLPVGPFPHNFFNPENLSDPYNHFYLDSVYKNYFRGTLVTERDLTQDYHNYDKNIAPLSLPPAAPGDINLASTDNLAFTIDQKDFKGDYFVTVDGSPMIFGPLYTNKDTVVASAVQVRNACY